MKVVVIGAGYSGIAAGIRYVHTSDVAGLLNAERRSVRFPQRVKNIDLTIYEKNAGIGGTWYSNRYPVRESISGTGNADRPHVLFSVQGLSCDIPSHTVCFPALLTDASVSDSKFQVPIHVRDERE